LCRLFLDLVDIQWAFDGWDQANYVAGEIKNPEKNIPRTIHFSMAIVTVGLIVHSIYEV
jgi:amino acid transporter